jgi:hypothetical protein
MKKLMAELIAMSRRETDVMTMTQRGRRWQVASPLSRFCRNASIRKNS